ncbi:MAG: type II toxin-antitoxin system Phd/YefM family antitoxin [Prevotellaceae bacterium]|jgi:prevent-host-death family protein|nr:type II toxin-antitoxin system Phd/YefM family antitoxin [Prevotellaceae bacterium]
MLVVSSREFRQNQAEYMDKVDKGEQVIVQRGKDKSYYLVPVSENGMYFTPEILERIKQALENAEKGNVTVVKTTKGLEKHLESL